MILWLHLLINYQKPQICQVILKFDAVGNFEALFLWKSNLTPKRQALELSLFNNRETTASFVIFQHLCI